MAENRNRTARSFSQRGNVPTAVAPADTESFVLPPRSSATRRESPRSSALSSTLVPASSLAVLPPLLIPASPVPSATARSECSSPTSVGHALIRCQRALLHLRRALPQVNQDLAFRSSRSQWDPLVMRRKRQHTVFALRFAVHRDPLAARADLHFLHHFPYPHTPTCQSAIRQHPRRPPPSSPRRSALPTQRCPFFWPRPPPPPRRTATARGPASDVPLPRYPAPPQPTRPTQCRTPTARAS